MSYLVISGHTPDQLYTQQSIKLLESLEKCGLQYEIYTIPEQGSWEKNCQYKATLIKQNLIKYPEKNIVWVDADAVFEQYPALFDSMDFEMKYQIGYHYFERTGEVLSGTLFFWNQPLTLTLVETWMERNKVNTQWDQRNLVQALRQVKVKTYSLPVAYCKIFDSRYQVCPDPVIVHYQASRQARKIRKR